MPRIPRVAVIGAGVGGLVCATKLAQSGLEVILLEQHDKVGGFAQGWTWKPKLRNGKRIRANFEITHAISEILPGEAMYQLYKELGVDMDRIGPFIPAKKFAVLRTPNDPPLEILNTVEENLEAFLFDYPTKTKEVRKLFDTLETLYRDIKSIDPGRPKWQTVLQCLIKPTFLRRHRQTFKRILDDCLGHDLIAEEMKIRMGILFGYGGLPSEEISGIFQTSLFQSYWKSGGAFAPQYTSFQTMSEALSEAFEQLPKTNLRLKTEAVKIDVEKRKIKGVWVKSENGQEYISVDHVVSAGDVKRTLNSLEEHFPKKYFQKIKEMKLSVSFFNTRLIIEKDLSDLEEKLSYAANVLAHSRKDITSMYGGAHYVSIPTLLRPDACLITNLDGNPLPDYHIVDIIGVDHLSHKKWKEKKRENTYRASKESIGRKGIEMTERLLIPGLTEAIQFANYSSPLTYERYGFSTEGAVYGFAPDRIQFLNRPSVKTPIEGFWWSGSGVLSAGVVGASMAGKMTADTILNYLSIKR